MVKPAGVTHVLGIRFRSFFGQSPNITNKIYFLTEFVPNIIFVKKLFEYTLLIVNMNESHQSILLNMSIDVSLWFFEII